MNAGAPRYRFALMGLALGLSLAACDSPARGTFAGFQAAVANPLLPTVEAVTAVEDGVAIRFSQVMAPTATAKALTVYKLRNHVGRDPAVAGEAVGRAVEWSGPRRLIARWTQAPGSYVVAITTGAVAASGRPLDGLTGTGAAIGFHRPEDDGLNGPAPYQSRAIQVGAGVDRFQGLPPAPQVVVTAVTAWRGNSTNDERNVAEEPVWSWGRPRIGIYPPFREHVSLRLAVTSAAGYPWFLLNPGALPGGIALKSSEGGRADLAINLSHHASAGAQFDHEGRVEVAAVRGLEVTTDSGPEVALDQMRKPGEPMWLQLGNLAPPLGLAPMVRNYGGADHTYTLAPMRQEVTAVVRGTTAATDRSWPAGMLDGGWSLVLGDGSEVPIVSATDRVLTLAGTVTDHTCACGVELRRLEERVEVGDPVFLTSNLWYAHPRESVPAGAELFYVVNENQLLRSLKGMPFRDDERDGDESVDPQVVDDTFVVQVGFRPNQLVQPPVSRLNDGLLYPPPFATRDFGCGGDASGGVCARPPANPLCKAEPATTEVLVSFATSDGSEQAPLGTNDLLESNRLKRDDVVVLAAGTVRPMTGVLDSEVVLNQTPQGTFPTTLLRYNLLEEDPGACPGGGDRFRGFRAGDKLVISHQIRALLERGDRTIDGNGDGVASASPVDDWIGEWDPRRGTFVPIDRHPEAP